MIKVACDYNIKEDIGFILESEKINNIEFAERAKSFTDYIGRNSEKRHSQR